MNNLDQLFARFIQLGSAVFLFVLIYVQPVPAAEKTLIFAPLPMENPDTVVSQWKPFIDYLEQQSGAHIQIYYAEDYADIIAGFSADRIDLAVFGPLPYVRLRAQFPPATPLVIFNEPDGEPFYTCAMIALEEKVTTSSQLQKMKMALTQPLSTCGYFSTNALLQQFDTSLDQHLYRYLDQHDAVAIAVARGDMDAGGLKTVIGRKYSHLGLVELAETAPLPAFSLVANSRRLSPELIERIRQLIVTAPATQRSSWGDNIRHGATTAADTDYDPVRRLNPGVDIPSEGNF